MDKRILLMVTAVAATLFSCGNKTERQAPKDSTNVVENVINKELTVFGMCGEASAMNTLQLITDSGDTLSLSVNEAKENNNVFGGYGIGDRMAVLLNDDKTEAKQVINETTLLGNWTMPDPFDGSSIVGMALKDGGIAESIDMANIVYKAWRITNGRLELTLMREGGSEEDEIEVYDIKKLDADSLVFGNDEDIFEYCRQK
ncbi:lipocalin family protein [Prevotella sp. MGM1]|uniref:lipocalin family protein n=1 Tax=Prevotella sp. MGM1 TaxID=2033405 RepID=UPI0013050329|nr:lipocalin family protein [Prevotella sp. MGM1]